MAIKKFDVAVSTISGSAFPNFLEITKNVKVDAGYRWRFTKAMLVSMVAEPFRWVENWKYGKTVRETPITADPVFILGHWRSGTTYLHNLLSQDRDMAYVTTYQSVFPNQLLSSRWLFRTLMNAKMPKKRPADNVKLDADYPQEEEFALGDINPYSFYNFWYFPKHTREYFDHYVTLKNFTTAEREIWKRDYELFIKKTLLNQQPSTRFLSKNPPHTGRIPLLLEMFPNAKFVHIRRNPITVFLSTYNFFTKTIPSLQFQEVSDAEMEDNILYVYTSMMQKFEADKALIPPGNLIEVNYEEFEEQPLQNMEQIYAQLHLPNFEGNRERFAKYIDSQKRFAVNKHQISEEKIQKVMHHLQFAMEQYQYTIPQDIEVLSKVPL